MKIIRTIAELRSHLASHRRLGRSIGLVPTMGSFHEGHLSLMRQARADCDVVVVSLFVNPTQFSPTEDLQAYPRDEGRDAAMAQSAGVDVLFAPDNAQIYPAGFATTVQVSGITDVLCGSPDRRSPAHFGGVTLVVAKLFNMVQPDTAYFGQKDAQQVLVIKRMVTDLDIPVQIRVLPTVREADGLAMSSRNAYLVPADRQRASSLNKALMAAKELYWAGEQSAEALLAAAAQVLAAAGVAVEYLELRSLADLSLVTTVDQPALIAVAARVGRARLIDNCILEPVSSNGFSNTPDVQSHEVLQGVNL